MLIAVDLASGKNQSNATPSFSGTGTSHHTAAPRSMPHLSGSPRFSPSGGTRTVPYRPLVMISNGSRTFVYPSVRSSYANPSLQAGSNRLNNTNAAHNFGVRGNLASKQTAMVSGTKANNLSRVNTNGQGSANRQTARLSSSQGRPTTLAQARSRQQGQFSHHHDHDWWRHHCRTIVLFDWGWWGWDGGWWYPAWGYDPYYAYYGYDQPIYGNDSVSPEQTVANVQGALQQQGYYDYAVDGRMGPLTQAAIGRFQRDHRLPITYGIDPATMGALGLIAQ